MSADEKKRWKAALKYFKKNAGAINAARNVVGGHFSKKAGEAVIDGLDRDTSARLEIKLHKSRKGAGVTFHFAGDIVAVGMAAKRGTDSEIVYLEKLFTIMRDAYMHLTNAVHVLAICYVIPRFQRK